MDTLTIQRKLNNPGYGLQLLRITGLTFDRYQYLIQASTGMLSKLNPATHIAMQALIDNKLQCTDLAYVLIRLVEAIAEDDFYVGPRDSIVYLQKHAKVLRKSYPHIRSIHIKTMIAIYNDGVLSENFLGRIYGGRTISDLFGFGLIEERCGIDTPGWRIYALSTAGDNVVQDYRILQERGTLL